MEFKVCGMTSIDQLHQLEMMEVKFAGFIFYPPSPRHVLKFGINGQDVRNSKLKIAKIGVFVDAGYDEIMRQIDAFGLDMVQLHGHETPFECSKISNYIDVIKAFRFAENDHVRWMIKDYFEATNMFLFDTGIYPHLKAIGTAPPSRMLERKFNWKKLKGLNIGRPFFLSGGIEPDSVNDIKQFLQDPVAKDLFVIDINSRFEIAPGLKDMKKIREFIDEIRD